MAVHIRDLEALIKEKFRIPDIDDDESDEVTPMLYMHLTGKPFLALPQIELAAKRPGSVVMTSVNLSETFSRMLAGKRNLRIAIMLTIPRGDFVGQNGEALLNYPFFSTRNFFFFFFDCEDACIDAFIEELGTKHNTSVLDIRKYRHVHAMQAKSRSNSDFSAIACRKWSKPTKKKGSKRVNSHKRPKNSDSQDI
jgi:hypothetical protein